MKSWKDKKHISSWKCLQVLDDEGMIFKTFEVNEHGELISRLPRQKNRRFPKGNDMDGDCISLVKKTKRRRRAVWINNIEPQINYNICSCQIDDINDKSFVNLNEWEFLENIESECYIKETAERNNDEEWNKITQIYVSNQDCDALTLESCEYVEEINDEYIDNLL